MNAASRIQRASSLWNLAKKFGRRQDRDSAVGIQDQKIIVPGHKVSGATAHRELKEHIIPRVATVADFDVNLDPFRNSGECGEEMPRFILTDIRAKFLPRQNLSDLCQDR